MIDFGPGSVVRAKKLKHQYSDDPKEWMEFGHPDKQMTLVYLLLGAERIDCTGPRIDVNEVLRAFGWTLPKLLPIGTEVDYNMTQEFSDGVGMSQFLRATISDHVEGWYELTFMADGSKAVVRPSNVHHESDQ